VNPRRPWRDRLLEATAILLGCAALIAFLWACLVIGQARR